MYLLSLFTQIIMTKPEYVGDIELTPDGAIQTSQPRYGTGNSETGKSEIDPSELESRLHGHNLLFSSEKDKLSVVAIRSGTKFKSEDVWQNYPNIHGIVRAGNGTDNIDQKQADARRVLVMNTPEGSCNNVAEIAISQADTFLKKGTESTVAFMNGKWLRGSKEENDRIKPKEWREVRVGVIGAGAIGRAFLQKAIDNGSTDVVFSDIADIGEIRFTTSGNEHAIATQVDLDELITTCDVISIHTGGKVQLLGRDEIQKIKNGAILINTSRPDNINFSDAIDRVNNGTLQLGVDVVPFEKENDKFNKLVIQNMQRAAATGRLLVTHHQGAESDISKKLVLDDTALRIHQLLELGVPARLPVNLRNPSNAGIGPRSDPGIRLAATYGDEEGAHHAITGALKDQRISFGGCVVFGDGNNGGNIATTIIDLPTKVTPEQAIAVQKEIRGLQGNFRVRLLRYA